MAQVIRIGSAPINWGIEGLFEGNADPDVMLEAIAADGYAGCELGAAGYFGTTSDEILERFRKHRLSLITTWFAVDLARPLDAAVRDELAQICDVLSNGGAGVLLISDKMTTERLDVVARVEEFPDTWWSEQEWNQVPMTLAQIHEIASVRGLTLAVHPHVGTHLESKAEIRRLVETTARTPIRLCLDTGHILIGGSDPNDLLESSGDRIVHVHAKDVDGLLLERVRRGELGYFPAVGNGLYPGLGTGLVDWERTRRGLQTIGYSGWVVAEQDQLLKPGSTQPFISNAHNFAFLHDWIGDQAFGI